MAGARCRFRERGRRLGAGLEWVGNGQKVDRDQGGAVRRAAPPCTISVVCFAMPAILGVCVFALPRGFCRVRRRGGVGLEVGGKRVPVPKTGASVPGASASSPAPASPHGHSHPGVGGAVGSAVGGGRGGRGAGVPRPTWEERSWVGGRGERARGAGEKARRGAAFRKLEGTKQLGNGGWVGKAHPVRGVVGRVGDLALRGGCEDGGLDLGGAGVAVEGEEEGGHPRGVGAGHGGACESGKEAVGRLQVQWPCRIHTTAHLTGGLRMMGLVSGDDRVAVKLWWRWGGGRCVVAAMVAAMVVAVAAVAVGVG